MSEGKVCNYTGQNSPYSSICLYFPCYESPQLWFIVNISSCYCSCPRPFIIEGRCLTAVIWTKQSMCLLEHMFTASSSVGVNPYCSTEVNEVMLTYTSRGSGSFAPVEQGSFTPAGDLAPLTPMELWPIHTTWSLAPCGSSCRKLLWCYLLDDKDIVSLLETRIKQPGLPAIW